MPKQKPKAKKINGVLLGGVGAGKTSILRRFFNGKFEDHRMPTLGADFYTRKIPWNQDGGSVDEDMPLFINMAIWDTPGKERFAANQKTKFTAAFPDSFFKNLDVALLVYDMTSSTSFTLMAKWHAELVERIKRMEAMGERTRPFPILVAANKMDIQTRDKNPSSRPHSASSQRAVMGFHSFKGKDIKYEYTSSANQPLLSSSSVTMIDTKDSSFSKSKVSTSNKKRSNRFEISTYMGTGDQTSYLEQFFNNEVGGSYLESLLSTEDDSHPDRDLVLLWCYRNGLSHYEVSALDNAGIDHLMKEMTRLALESTKQVIKPSLDKTISSNVYRWNDELDLHRRYISKKKKCLFPSFFKTCCREVEEEENNSESFR